MTHHTRQKEEAMTHIDPATCDPGTPFWVRIPGVDRDLIGQRVDPDDDRDQWKTLGEDWGTWLSDSEVNVLRPVDEPQTDWGILRQAVGVLRRVNPSSRAGVGWLLGIADRLEAEHKAAQEKAAADTKREALIEKAARVIFASDDVDLDWDDPALGKMRDEYAGNARALADAGLLADVEAAR